MSRSSGRTSASTELLLQLSDCPVGGAVTSFGSDLAETAVSANQETGADMGTRLLLFLDRGPARKRAGIYAA
jgi:hypothetical protein